MNMKNSPTKTTISIPYPPKFEMTCKANECKMFYRACILRQKLCNIIIGSGMWMDNYPIITDFNCLGCTQGSVISSNFSNKLSNSFSDLLDQR